MEEKGTTEQSAAQEQQSQSADTNTNAGNNDQSAGQETTSQSTDKTLEELSKVKQALAEVLQKKDHYKGLTEKLQSEAEKAARIAAESATDPKEQQERYEKIIDDWRNKYTGLEQDHQKDKVGSQVKDIAMKLKAVDPNQVLKIIKDDIIFDVGGRIVIDDGKGGAAINMETGKILTVEEYVARVLKVNTNLVQPSGQTGAGSTATTTGTSATDYKQQGVVGKMSNAEYAKQRSVILESIGK